MSQKKGAYVCTFLLPLNQQTWTPHISAQTHILPILINLSNSKTNCFKCFHKTQLNLVPVIMKLKCSDLVLKHFLFQWWSDIILETLMWVSRDQTPGYITNMWSHVPILIFRLFNSCNKDESWIYFVTVCRHAFLPQLYKMLGTTRVLRQEMKRSSMMDIKWSERFHPHMTNWMFFMKLVKKYFCAKNISTRCYFRRWHRQLGSSIWTDGK